MGPEPAVSVAVTFNGAAWAGAAVTLSEPGETTTFHGVTGDDGILRTSVSRAGVYVVSVREPKLPYVWSKEENISEEEGSIAVACEGDTLEVNTSGGGQGTVLNMSTAQLTARTLVPLKERPLRLRLPPGRYALSSSDAAGRASAVVDLDVAGRGETRVIELIMFPSTGFAIVRDADGLPVMGTTIIGSGKTATSVGPGQFSLTGFPPLGAVIITARGYVPLCRVFQPGMDLVATLRRGEPAVFGTDIEWNGRIPGTVLQVPGADCEVPLAAFDVRPRGSEAGLTRLIIANFPKNASLEWRLDGIAVGRIPNDR